jgi:hypothetical protein
MTFTKSLTTITVAGSIYGRTKVTSSRKQNRYSAEDGTAYVYSRNVTEWFVNVSVRITVAQLANFLSFFRSTVEMSKYTFTFIPDANMDAGAGMGTNVTARLWQDDLPEPHDQPGSFVFDLIFRCSSTGTGFPS